MSQAIYTESANNKGIGAKSDAFFGLLLITPILITMAGLVFYPLLSTIWDSLHRVTPMQPGTPFVGLKNYTRMFSDRELGQVWGNTFKFVVLAVFFETVFGVRYSAMGPARRCQRRHLAMDLCAGCGSSQWCTCGRWL
jgi:multiple sugar transport system permease protein